MKEKNKGYFIVCEGLDCAGKTTTIKEALNYFDGNSVVYSKGLKTNTLAGKISALFPSTLTLLFELLYLDRKDIRKSINEGKIIIQDRWYYSVLSHNSKNRRDTLLGKIFTPLLKKPDFLIYFTVPLEERVKRLENAERSKDHLALLQNPKLILEKEERFLEHYNEFQGDKIIFNTSGSKKENGYKLYKIIERRLK